MLKDSSLMLKVKRRRCDAERRRGYARLVVCGGDRQCAPSWHEALTPKRAKLKNENKEPVLVSGETNMITVDPPGYALDWIKDTGEGRFEHLTSINTDTTEADDAIPNWG